MASPYFRTILTLSFATLLGACASAVSESTRGPHPDSNPNAAIIIEEFADLQCPACRAAHSSVVQPLLERHGEDIRYEFKHFPIRQIHQYAMVAAEAAECAADQGKFWEFVDYNFANQGDLDDDILPVWAKKLDLDVAVFEKCLKSGEKRGIILAGYKEGRERGVKGTPTFFINGEKVNANLETMEEIIKGSVSEWKKNL